MSCLTFGNAKFVSVCLVILLALAAAQPVGAAFVPWDNPAGSNSAYHFSWSDGGCENNWFGSPDMDSENTFIFSPLNFEAVSFDGVDGDDDTIFDTFEFNLQADAGYGFETILITANGTYGIDGSGNVDSSGLLSVENLDTHMMLSQSFLFTDTLNGSSVAGTWQRSAQLSIPASWTNIKVNFQNILSANTAGYGSFASIANTDSGATISVQIPEPATIAVLGIGVLSFIRRKNK